MTPPASPCALPRQAGPGYSIVRDTLTGRPCWRLRCWRGIGGPIIEHYVFGDRYTAQLVAELEMAAFAVPEAGAC